MKYVIKFSKINVLIVLTLSLFQCKDFVLIDEDNLNNPNELTQSSIDVDLLLNNIQKEAKDVYLIAAERTAELTRMEHMSGPTYKSAGNFQATSFSSMYISAYADLFIDVKNLLAITDDPESDINFSFYSGMAKVLKAYTMLTMVDLFGDIPYSEALDESNFNPKLEAGKDVYDKALALLDEAITNLGDSTRARFPNIDLYYGTAKDDDKPDLWIRAANTIKLKAYLNTNASNEINSLISTGKLIVEPDHDFKFSFSTNEINPLSRHPWFFDNYDSDGGSDYMSVNYMNLLLNDKTDLVDPRIRYYFYRQVNKDTRDTNENDCINSPKPSHYPANIPFCKLGKGYWGRNFLNNSGIPPDGLKRTVYGVYPVGGEFDADQPSNNDDGIASVSKSKGLQGAGIAPILMSSFTHFMIAEAELRLNNNPTKAKTYLDNAITLSMQTVKDFGKSVADASFEMRDADVTNYKNFVSQRWSTVNDRLKNISKEYYLALWTNGIEAYNLMRRTGFPNSDDLQPAEGENPGTWYRSFRYPSVMVDRNSSVSQKDETKYGLGPFWADNTIGDFDF